VLEAFGKNEQTKKVFRALFAVSRVVRPETGECHRSSDLRQEKVHDLLLNVITFFDSLAGLVLAEVADPETTRQILGILTGTGG